MINILANKIHFIKPTDQLIPITLGKSGAKVYKLLRENKTFLLKIVHKSKSHKNDKKLYYQLELLNYKTAKLINVCKYKNLVCYLFEFIDGTNLHECLNNNTELYARQVAENLNLLKQVTCNLKEDNIYKIHKIVLKNIKTFFKYNIDISVKKETFISHANTFVKSFYHLQKRPIHGDIKPLNCIYSGSSTYIIDNDDIKVSYDAFNFQFSAHMFYNNQNAKDFFVNIIKIQNNGIIPAYMDYNIKYILLLKFFDRTTHYLKINKTEKVNNLINIYKPNFKEILTTQTLPWLK